MTHDTWRAVLGWLWIALWAAALWALCWPWAGLGYMLTDAQHWWLQASVWFGVPLGLFGGWHGRELSAQQPRRSRSYFLRRWHFPLGAGVALALVAVRCFGDAPVVVAVLVRTWVALAAGFDVAYAAWPLVCGEDYRVYSRAERSSDITESSSPADPLEEELREAEWRQRSSRQRFSRQAFSRQNRPAQSDGIRSKEGPQLPWLRSSRVDPGDRNAS